MGGSNSWRQAQSGSDWMREMEKRLLHEERRPGVRTAADILGPGIAPYSIPITDWNSNETSFNGYFHSLPGALNTPSELRYWMGTSQATADGSGIQRVTEYQGVPLTYVVWVRRFSTPPGGTRIFTTWTMEDGNDSGWLDMASWATGWTASGGLGGPAMWQARQFGNKVELRGNVVNTTFTGGNIVICTLDPLITPPPQTSGFVVVGSVLARWGSVLATGEIQVTTEAAGGGWWQIVGSYLTD